MPVPSSIRSGGCRCECGTAGAPALPGPSVRSIRAASRRAPGGSAHCAARSWVRPVHRKRCPLRSPQAGSEVWAAALMVDGHDDELSGCHSVAHGIREAGGGDLSLEDVTLVVVDRGCSDVRRATSPCDRRASRRDEAVAQTRLLLLVPFPCAEDISLGERMEREGQAHTVWFYGRRSSMRKTRCSHVTSSASPASSCVALRSVSADHSRSTSASSRVSESRLASRPEASSARSSTGSVSACSRSVSAASVTTQFYPNAEGWATASACRTAHPTHRSQRRPIGQPRPTDETVRHRQRPRNHRCPASRAQALRRLISEFTLRDRRFIARHVPNMDQRAPTNPGGHGGGGCPACC